MLAFTRSWTGLPKEQLRFYPPHIFCNPTNRRPEDAGWTAGGGGGWHRDGRWWGGNDSQMMFNTQVSARSTSLSWNLCSHFLPLRKIRFCAVDQAAEPPRDYSLDAELGRWGEWTAAPVSLRRQNPPSLR